jgi:hypothetical protein
MAESSLNNLMSSHCCPVPGLETGCEDVVACVEKGIWELEPEEEPILSGLSGEG